MIFAEGNIITSANISLNLASRRSINDTEKMINYGNITIIRFEAQ